MQPYAEKMGWWERQEGIRDMIHVMVCFGVLLVYLYIGLKG